eukprot:2444523-Rhodomonas_salina.1
MLQLTEQQTSRAECCARGAGCRVLRYRGRRRPLARSAAITAIPSALHAWTFASNAKCSAVRQGLR